MALLILTISLAAIAAILLSYILVLAGVCALQKKEIQRLRVPGTLTAALLVALSRKAEPEVVAAVLAEADHCRQLLADARARKEIS